MAGLVQTGLDKSGYLDMSGHIQTFPGGMSQHWFEGGVGTSQHWFEGGVSAKRVNSVLTLIRRRCPPDSRAEHACLPDDVWQEILGWYRAGETLGELKQLRDIAWINHASAYLASSHPDNWPWIRANARDPLYRSQHRRPAPPVVDDSF